MQFRELWPLIENHKFRLEKSEWWNSRESINFQNSFVLLDHKGPMNVETRLEFYDHMHWQTKERAVGGGVHPGALRHIQVNKFGIAKYAPIN